MIRTRLALFSAVLWLQFGGSVVRAQQEVGFLERFALSSDRREVLAELIPGTEEFFYFYCLHHQNEGQLAEAQAVLEQWRAKIGETARVQQMQARQMLLTYGENPQRSLDYLRDRLGLDLNHAPPSRDRAAELPNAFDNARLATAAMIDRAIAQDRALSKIETSGLPLLLDRELAQEQLRALLKRIDRADLPKIVQRVAEELSMEFAREFGWAPVHQQLTLAQLDELLGLRPQLIEQDGFVRAYAARLAPAEGTSLADKVELRAYLGRLVAFARKLPQSQNSFKALVIGNLLKLDMSEGKYDRALFLEYLSLPRNAFYYDLTRFRNATPPLAELGFVMQPHVSLPAIGDDALLVQRYLEHFFKSADKVDDFAKYLDREYLESVLAETKILYGLGNASSWYAKLNPEKQKALKDRVELRFRPENRHQFGVKDDVALQVELKNVSQLVVKIYQINLLNHYRNSPNPIGTDIDLDGLVANVERKFDYSQASELRHLESIALPELEGRGVWVVDLLGGGQRSRAVIQKGGLIALERLADAGHVYQIMDEEGTLRKSAHVEMNGRTYEADSEGRIVVPYAEADVTRNLLLVDEGFASIQMVAHRSESYQLQAGFLVDRQSLIAGTQASMAVRIRLSCNGRPVSIKLLEEPTLTIVATDVDGVATTQVVGSLDLDDGDDLEHKFVVPQRLASISFKLSGRVYNQSLDERQQVSASHTLSLNGIQQSDQIADFYLRQNSDGYQLLVLGRNGEPVARLPVSLSAKVAHFANPVTSELATDEKGTISLGKLDNVQTLSVSAQGLQAMQFVLHSFHRNWPSELHAGVDSKLVLPLGKQTSESTHFSLIEMRHKVPFAVHGEKLKVNAGAVEIEGLPAGNYVLQDYESGQSVRIVIADAKEQNAIAAAKHRILQTSRPLIAIREAKIENGKLVVKVTGADKSARLHLLAQPLFPESSRGHDVQLPYAPLMWQQRNPIQSLYVDSLRLDEEYGYILQRQGANKYPGNMLAQPTLLIHPWEISTTQNSSVEAAAGDPLSKGSILAEPMGIDALGEAAGERLGVRPDWKSFDFLATPAVISANFAIEDGQVSVPVEQLRGYSNLTVLAVQVNSADSRELVVPKSELLVRDQRLKSAFDANIRLAQTQRVEVLPANEKKVLGDPRTRRVQTYASIADVFRLYGTLLENSDWEKFSFIAQWHKLSDEQRRVHYNEMACHELNFFLYHKDRKFFDSVVKPLIKQKLQKQLVDLWLLGESLESYNELWRVQRLNTLERVLLARSVASRLKGTSRWLSDFVEANPIDPQWRAQRFEVALRGMALDTDMRAALQQSLEVDYALRFDSRDKAGAGMGGMGGGMPGGMGMGAEERFGAPKAVIPMEGKRKQRRGKEGGDTSEYLGLELLRENRESLFRTLDQTREWAESQYYRVQLQNQIAELIPPSAFWREYIDRQGDSTFLPSNLDLPTKQINEALCALAVIDLPLDGRVPEVLIEDEQLALKTTQPVILFVESIEKAGEANGDDAKKDSVLVGQDVYLAQPSTNMDFNRPVQGPLLRGVPYRASVVVTNPTNTKKRVQVLTQVPAGSLPLASGKVTRNTPIDLAPYSTAQIQFAFYFPNEGEFAHYGSQISSGGIHLAATESKSYRVLAKPESVDETTWDYIADWGTNEQVMEFLKKANLASIDLGVIAFRMEDKPFFTQVTDYLNSQGVFEPELWAYAVKHNEPKQVQQLIQHHKEFVAQLGPQLSSPLAKIDVDEQMSYEHLDYKPLVVARAHRLGAKTLILNDKLFIQYNRLLDVIAHQRTIGNEQKLAMCYYMLLQNRIDEGLSWFSKVDSQGLATRLQYDYFDAYLDFYRGKYDEAAQIASQYADYPVLMWKDLFAQVSDHVKQRKALQAGQDIVSVTSLDGNSNRQQRMLTDGREARQTEAAAETPTLDLVNQDGSLSIDYRNLSDVRVNYYLMDIELLFSRNPFVSRSGDKVPVIEPNLSENIGLESAIGSRKIELPEKLQNRNLLVEVTSKGMSRSTVITANSLTVSVVEPFGRVQVLAARGRVPLEQAYVKVYARGKDGSVKFYKDGYTDLRGQFDYATLSTSALDNVERFAILILHESQGAVVREAAPPAR